MVILKIRIQNPALSWLGRHVFPIYFYHPFVFLLVKWLWKGHVTIVWAHIWAVLTLLATLAFASLYKFWQVTETFPFRVNFHNKNQ